VLVAETLDRVLVFFVNALLLIIFDFTPLVMRQDGFSLGCVWSHVADRIPIKLVTLFESHLFLVLKFVEENDDSEIDEDEDEGQQVGNPLEAIPLALSHPQILPHNQRWIGRFTNLWPPIPNILVAESVLFTSANHRDSLAAVQFEGFDELFLSVH